MRYKILLIGLIFYSCASNRMIETSLFFGQAKPGGGMVTQAEWDKFKEEYISKVFREGSTVVPVSGNWMDTEKHKLISEPTYMVLYYYRRSAGLSRQIDSLRHWYKVKFDQQSVLRVDKKVNASF